MRWYHYLAYFRSMPEKLHEKGKTPKQRIVERVLW